MNKMKKKITWWLDNFFEWLEEKNIHIGDLEFCTSVYYTPKGRKRNFDLCPDCENCHFGWDCTSYEGECEDCGCYIDHDFDVSKFYCAIPWRVKKLIKKVKGWE